MSSEHTIYRTHAMTMPLATNIPSRRCLLLALACLTGEVCGYSFSWSATSNTFAGQSLARLRAVPKSNGGKRNTLVMYEDDYEQRPDSPDPWSALASTERWISATLSSSNNPYARKEVSYVCETSDDVESVVAGIFRRLREAREIGGHHGEAERERLAGTGNQESEPRTHRETQVVVLPSCKALTESFSTFDNLIMVVNNARRNARDYVTDIAVEKRDEGQEDDWITSVNLAHLHPLYDTPTAPESSTEEDGPELRAYKERRTMARQSPFPTIVIEVRASPPMRIPDEESKQREPVRKTTEEDVTRDDLSKLEALFTQSVANHPGEEEKKENTEADDFYEAIASTGIEELTFFTPLQRAQNWVAQHDAHYDPGTSTFTVGDAEHVDEAYEFVFSSVAAYRTMTRDTAFLPAPNIARSYLVLSRFLSSSATSFEKFADEVRRILKAACDTTTTVSTSHPEHVDQDRRSPVPIFVLRWNDEKGEE